MHLTAHRKVCMKFEWFATLHVLRYTVLDGKNDHFLATTQKLLLKLILSSYGNEITISIF